MSDSRRPTNPVRTPDDVSRQYQRGEANVRAQERGARSGENVHGEVLRSMARLAHTFSEPRLTRSVLPVNERRIVRRRPSTVNTPGFRHMITQMNEDSADAIRTRTAARIQSLGSYDLNSLGEESLSDLIGAVDLGRKEDHDETEFTASRAAPYREHRTNDDNARNSVDDESSVEESSAKQQNQGGVQASWSDDEILAPSPEDEHFYVGYNTHKETPRAKYYAVRRGLRPGIYRTWEECEQQVGGFSNCAFKSFKTEHEARQYLAQGKSASSPRGGKEHKMSVERKRDTYRQGDDFRSRTNSQEVNLERAVDHEGHEQDITVARNDAVQIGTVQRRNITHRKSQGRVRDRVSLGQPSIPVELLLARKAQPRDIDVEYKMEALTPTTPPLPQHSDVGRGSFQPSYPATNMPLPNGVNTPLPEELSRCWRDKMAIEGAIKTAMQEGNEHNYRHWEAKHQEVNEQIYRLLCHAPRSAGFDNYIQQRVLLTPPDMGQVVRDDNIDDKSSSTDSNKDWRFQGSSFVIYLETPDTVIPWVVWETMPVSLLMQAGISLLARSHRVVDHDCVSLMHHGVVMDSVHGYLSDYSVLNDDVVIVHVTMPRGGLVSDRNQGRQTSKPLPTFEPNDQPRHDRKEGKEDDNDEGGLNNRSYDKLKQTFKCPKFTGFPKDWKAGLE